MFLRHISHFPQLSRKLLQRTSKRAAIHPPRAHAFNFRDRDVPELLNERIQGKDERGLIRKDDEEVFDAEVVDLLTLSGMEGDLLFQGGEVDLLMVASVFPALQLRSLGLICMLFRLS
jgi:hypothetical protein